MLSQLLMWGVTLACRFYFLSNDELLEILAETKDPLRVQPFLKKIFEGIHQLVFEPNLNVTAMKSEEGEQVAFIKIFNPKDAQGAVERWLTQARLNLMKHMQLLVCHSRSMLERDRSLFQWQAGNIRFTDLKPVFPAISPQSTWRFYSSTSSLLIILKQGPWADYVEAEHSKKLKPCLHV